MNEFWVTFWPNVAATLLGVVLGVPVALWLNRLSMSAAVRRDESAGQARLHMGIEALLAALAHNQESLRVLAGRIGQRRMAFDSTLDTGAWEASRDEIVPFLREPDLQRRIAFYFSRLEALRRLSVLNIDVAAGRVTNTPTVTEDLRTHLLAEIRELLEDANRLMIGLREVSSTTR